MLPIEPQYGELRRPDSQTACQPDSLSACQPVSVMNTPTQEQEEVRETRATATVSALCLLATNLTETQ